MQGAGSREWEELVNDLFRSVLDREADLKSAEARRYASGDDVNLQHALREAHLERDHALVMFHSLVIPELRSRAASQLRQAGQDPDCIAHDAVTSLYLHRAAIEGSAWRYLLVTVRNQGINLKKKRRSWVPLEDDLQHQLGLNALQKMRPLSETEEFINEWFEALKGHSREIVDLRLQGFSTQKIASQLGMSLITVKRRLAALRSSLRTSLRKRIQ